ncbi:hypothetical protein [Leptolyngbya sp. Cla-17]|nr:hypothetical protein [Leptolyngbya sp. Cla-17]
MRRFEAGAASSQTSAKRSRDGLAPSALLPTVIKLHFQKAI